ncbi:MAG: pilus assembly protein PilP [Gammaproteobacteria bacterium]|nr:pilus assembly protein PilP [Gammaproteobacteria bacterium]
MMLATHTQFTPAHHKAGLPLKSILGTIFLFIALVGCVNDNVSDLQAHVAQVKAKKPPPIPPLPEIKPYETYVYDETTLRDPFQASVARKVVRSDDAYRPNMKRQREILEQFPLDTLAMVGSLEQGGERWALIRAKDGTLYRTKKGRYIGQDYGEIIRVTETEIVLQETVPDGLGGWVRRQATLSVSE